MDTQALIRRYAEGPDVVRESLRGLSAADLSLRPETNKWSAREIALHIADMEVAANFRLKRIIAEPGATYPGVDEARWTQAIGQPGRELEPALQMLAALRRDMAAILQRLPAAAWEQTGVHDRAGPQTLLDVVAGFTRHLENHAAQIRAIRDRLVK